MLIGGINKLTQMKEIRLVVDNIQHNYLSLGSLAQAFVKYRLLLGAVGPYK